MLAAAIACNGEIAPKQEDQTTLVVFAAASLTEVFGSLADAFEKEHPGTELVLNFAGSPTLLAQARAGATFDILAVADVEHMEAAWVSGLVQQPVAFASNRLVMIVPADNPAGVQTINDLARSGVKLVLALPGVPAGRYAREALSGLGIAEAVEANVVSNAQDVKGVVSQVVLGEADAGIVYASDVTQKIRDAVRVFPLPRSVTPRATYPIATSRQTENPELAQLFVDLLRSSTGQALLVEEGFEPR